ncbi:flagellar motor protein MotB [Devosia rhodophyticola]|uniref:Flagellar motor protein MotB n=1 Tax=Devosia rhodophyticola TaxID=3026423 RepID=A0ABY7Z093_9HYPH|nr:flagellar motor protein MotB [Devosia rhodophyticola]WDR07055.1 flagellar motor protein MotB [Devosia rhodophyticola]
MAMRKKVGGGAPEWMVTFGDLMSILVCFFVLLISFSIQDTKKLQVVAGSMREAFGSSDNRRLSGVIEQSGNPAREFVKDASDDLIDMEKVSISSTKSDKNRMQGVEANTFEIEKTPSTPSSASRWLPLPYGRLGSRCPN